MCFRMSVQTSMTIVTATSDLSIFIDFYRFLSIFIDFLSIFIDFYRFLSMFIGFYRFFIDFSSIFHRFLPSGEPTRCVSNESCTPTSLLWLHPAARDGDVQAQSGQTLRGHIGFFHRFFIDFPRLSSFIDFFIDVSSMFHRFSIDFPSIFLDFPSIYHRFIDFYRFFIDFSSSLVMDDDGNDDAAKQNKTKQNETRQNKTKQDKTNCDCRLRPRLPTILEAPWFLASQHVAAKGSNLVPHVGYPLKQALGRNRSKNRSLWCARHRLLLLLLLLLPECPIKGSTQPTAQPCRERSHQ